MTSFLQGPLTDSVFTDSVTFAEVSKRNDAGDPIVGTKKIVPARVERVQDLVTSSSGSQVISKHMIVTLIEIPEDSFVWVTDDTDQAKALRPISTKSAKAPSGFSIYETKL